MRHTIALAAAVVYGVYDFTNYSTLQQWPFVLTLVGVARGAVALAVGGIGAGEQLRLVGFVGVVA